MLARWLLLLSFTSMAGCALDEPADDAPWQDGKADGTGTAGVAATHLQVDLARLAGVATLELESDRSNVELEAAGLDIKSVADDTGARRFDVVDGKLRVAAVSGPLVIEYGFAVRDDTGGFQDGLLPGGSTVTYPYFCGNLFPCRSRPADGSTFTLAIDNVPAGETAIYPTKIDDEAPAHQLAWAVGDYTKRELGTTRAGTRLSVYWLPGDQLKQVLGTEHLVAAFDWLERTIGPYRYGSEVATVDVEWRPGEGGVRGHHPFLHVPSVAFDRERSHIAAAASGWFGHAVRPRCWEDLVLAHGTSAYLVARAVGQVQGTAAEDQLWNDYYSELIGSEAGEGAPAWPTGCNEIDPIWGRMLLGQGAFFYKDVAGHIGADRLDQVIAKFYTTYAGRAAGMQDMLDMIKADTGFDPARLAQSHLRVRSTIKVVPD